MTNTELQKIRENLNLTKSDFAKLLGLTTTMYTRCENGRSVISERIEKKVMELAAETQDISDPAVDEKTASRKTTVKKAKEVVDAAKDAVKSTARKAAKGAARKVAEKVVDDLVDRAVANAKAIPAEVSTPAVEEKEAAALAVEEKPAPKKAEKKTVSTPVKTKPAPKKAPAPKKTTKSPSVFIESLSGNQISVEALLTKVPANALSIYVKPGENKAYWVSKRDAGSVDLW